MHLCNAFRDSCALAKGLVVLVIFGCLLVPSVLLAAAAGDGDGHGRNNFDARAAYNKGYAASVPTKSAVAAGPGAVVDPAFGTVRTLWNTTGRLTGSASGDAMTIAIQYMQSNYASLGLEAGDVASYEVTDTVVSPTGTTRIYMRQLHGGLPVFNGVMSFNISQDGSIISVNNTFCPNLAGSSAPQPSFNAAEAVAAVLEFLGNNTVTTPALLSQGVDAQQTSLVDHTGISADPIEAKLMIIPVRRGEAPVVWNFNVATLDGQHYYNFNVDATTGEVWTRIDFVADTEYRVYPEPVESPNHTTPLPPADARVLVENPEDPTASPLGWHDDGTDQRTTMRGNNTHAYHDRDGNNLPPNPVDEPDCDDGLGGISCDFPIDLAAQPPASVDAAVANLFYWNNIIHDTQYHYGFDEDGGNFQVDNFGNGGFGGDDVRAEAQDNDIGGSNCNANMFTPPDGNRPRMQMFTCANASPERDGDYDNGVIVHEYGHGISIRQVGGPSNSSCLGNLQQGGEGYSDWWALAYTATVDDQATDARGIGTYLFGQAADGPGIRRFPYSTDLAVNPDTYETIGAGVSIPHGVGSVWTAIAWDVYWALVDEHGFSADLANAFGGAGNQRAMLYINEGMQNSVCGPTFIDMRNAVIQSAADNFGGEDVCRMWEAFARRGLGVDAETGGPNSLAAQNGFDIPLECQCQPPPIAAAGPDQVICQDEFAALGGPQSPFNTYEWSTGETTPEISVSPIATSEFTVTASTDLCGSRSDSATVFVQGGPGGIADDFESGAPGWSATGLWHLTNPATCAGVGGPDSPATAFYFGIDATCTYDEFPFSSSGELTSPVILGVTADSELSFNFWREVEFFPFGDFDIVQVDIVNSEGDETTVLFLSSADFSAASWTNFSIPVGQFAGQAIQVRFTFDTLDPFFNFFTGWFIDDVQVTNGRVCPVDFCPDTVLPEGEPSEGLGVNRFALVDADGVFDTTPPEGEGPGKSFTLEDTGGCSCTQIIEQLGVGEGHEKFGCSISVMEEWVSIVNGQ